MDAGVCYADDYISVQSRADDVINVAGHRIAASSIEEVNLQGGRGHCGLVVLGSMANLIIPSDILS